MKRARFWLLAPILVLLLSLLPVHSAYAATYTVINTNDSGAGSLRWAINQANLAGADTIAFNIPGAGVHTIQPLTPLPALVDNETTIDGYTQPGAAPATDLDPATILIEINGSLAGGNASGLGIISDNNLVRGLAINRFAWGGIILGGYTGISATNNIISGNYVGTDAAGTTDLGNGLVGVFIALGADQNTVGGTSPAERNVISGNGEGVAIHGAQTRLNSVLGNYIGTDASGTIVLGNDYNGVRLYGGARENSVGGYVAGGGNVVSGNLQDGVRLAGAGTSDNVVAGNYIGTTSDGLAALANAGSGVYVTLGAQGNTIGGDDELGRNVISGNLANGVTITGTATLSNTVAGNYIGTGADGAVAVGNAEAGVEVSGGACRNTIGGVSNHERNVISGNGGSGVDLTESGTMSNTVWGNYIGVNVTGTAALGNSSGVVIFDATDNLIGGIEFGRRNLISGNRWSGILLINPGTTRNSITGNWIGTSITGNAALGNGENGISVYQEASGNIIGPYNVISGNTGNGITLGVMVTGTMIVGNWIGTMVGGADALGNTENGIYLDWATNNTIGGDSPAERNVISGNGNCGIYLDEGETTDNVISGNYIGIDVLGMASVGNHWAGIEIWKTNYNRVGGTAPGERNVISGNGGPGVEIWGGSQNSILGNYIGTNPSGTLALANLDGVTLVDGADYNVVGGSTPQERNIISGNRRDGMIVNASSDNTVIGNYIGLDVTGTAALSNTADGIALNVGSTDNIVGGATDGERNVISANGHDGILLENASTNTILGNWIGTDAGGTVPLGNGGHGLYLGSNVANNIIGGTEPGQGNVIAANGGNGILLIDNSATGNVIAGNYIGTDSGATLELGNGENGVKLDFGTTGNTLGPANVIAHNAGNGVLVSWATVVDNDITQNSIYDNVLKGIELITDSHGGIAAPTITAVLVEPGVVTVEGTACTGCIVEIFQNSDDDGEGEFYLGSCFADAEGSFTLALDPLLYPYLTATATGAAEGTSEFSSVYTTTVTYEVYLPIVVRAYP